MDIKNPEHPKNSIKTAEIISSIPEQQPSIEDQSNQSTKIIPNNNQPSSITPNDPPEDIKDNSKETKANSSKQLDDIKSKDEVAFINDKEEHKRKIETLKTEFKVLFDTKLKEINDDLTEFEAMSINEVFQNNIQYSQNRKECNKKIKKIDQLFSFANVIKQSVQSNLDIMHILLIKNSIDIIKNIRTIKQFVGENMESILKSWLITNLDSDQLSNIKQSLQTPQNIKNYIFQDLKKALKLLVINGKKEDLNANDINKINKGNLQKFSLKSLNKTTFDKVFSENNESLAFPKVTKINIQRCNFENVSIQNIFPELERLEISLSKINLKSIESMKLNRLTEISLSRINLTNKGWTEIRKSLKKNTVLLNNLEALCLSHNKLTSFCLIREKDDNDDEEDNPKYPNLKLLDLEDNKISKYYSNIVLYAKNIKIISLVSNNFAYQDFFTVKSPILMLLQKNQFLFKTGAKEFYLEYLYKRLKIFDYELKTLSFDFLYDRTNKAMFKQLEFSPKIQESLKELCLSYCSLTNQDIVFLCQSNLFNKVKKLDISHNLLNENIFKELKIDQGQSQQLGLFADNVSRKMSLEAPIGEKTDSKAIQQERYVFERFSKLELLNLSGNIIKATTDFINDTQDFLMSNPMIKKIEFFNTPFDDSINNLIKEIKKREKKVQTERINNSIASITSIASVAGPVLENDPVKEKEAIKILKGIIEDISKLNSLSSQQFLQSQSQSQLPTQAQQQLQECIILLNFLQITSRKCPNLKLYFKNSFGQSTSKRLKQILKILNLKRLNERNLMILPQ